MRVPDGLRAAFHKVKPDLLPEELTEEKCIELLEKATGTGFAGSIDNSLVQKSESEIKLQTRCRLLEEELRLALLAGEDIRALKLKASHIMAQFGHEKERVIAAEQRKDVAEKRAEMLIAHTEKLMKVLKAEAVNKLKLAEQVRNERRVAADATSKLSDKSRIISAQGTLITELRAGSAILESQLRLMDERFYELRMKLDAARSNQKKYVKKAVDQAKTLRQKFTQAFGPRYHLDDVQLQASTKMSSRRPQTAGAPGTPQQTNFNSVSFTGLDHNDSIAGAGSGGLAPPEPTFDPFTVDLTHVTPGKIRPNMGTSGGSRGSSGKKSRPRTAPGGSGRCSSSKKKQQGSGMKSPQVEYGFTPSGNDEKDVDKIINKIYNKQSEKNVGKWTPDNLKKLVQDDFQTIPDVQPEGFVDTSAEYEKQRASQLDGGL